MKEETEDSIFIGGRDTSLFLFRALGKILYSKSKFLYSIKTLVLESQGSRFESRHEPLLGGNLFALNSQVICVKCRALLD